MKVAVTYDADGQIFQHFGHTRQLKVYNIANDAVTNSEVVSTGQNGHGGMASFIKSLDAEVLICGGIGGPAKKALADAGITFYPYARGSADEAVKAYMNGTLAFDMAKSCSVHAHDDHNCGQEYAGGCSMHDTCGKHN